MTTQLATVSSHARPSQQQQREQFILPQQSTALLLIDPHSNRFELVQLNSKNNDTTEKTNAAIIIAQIPRIATNELFRSVHYVGIEGSSNVRVALPHGMSTRACMRWARSILTTDPVRSMLTKNGYDLQEWYSLQHDVLVMLVDLDSKRFEMVVMENIQTLQDCLHQIALRATDPFLKQQQQYVGFCDPMEPHKPMMMEEKKKKNERRSMSSSQVLVALPRDRTPQECAALARSILATQAVVQTLHSHGFHVPLVPFFSNAIVLLLDPNKTRRMECLRMDGLSSMATTSLTVAHVWEYIQRSAQEPALREQSYVALVDAAGQVATSSLHVLQLSRTWVAVPLGISVRKCRAMARSIYTSAPVQQMLQQNGLDANEWRTPSTP